MNDRRFVMNAILVLSLWALVGASLAAQNAPATNGASVKMLVTVEAVHGSDVPDIHREDVMVHEGPLVAQGYIAVPRRPGLGVELNPDVVKGNLAEGEKYWD